MVAGAAVAPSSSLQQAVVLDRDDNATPLASPVMDGVGLVCRGGGVCDKLFSFALVVLKRPASSES